MALTSLTLNCNLSWALQKNNTGFAATKFGPASQFFDQAGIDTATVNQIANLRYTSIAADATQTVDLKALTNLVGESVAFGHVLGLFVQCAGTGSELTFGPGASNGLQWIFGDASTLVLPAGAGMCFAAPVGSTGAVVDNTHKTLDFTNSGASSMTSLTISIWGKTT